MLPAIAFLFYLTAELGDILGNEFALLFYPPRDEAYVPQDPDHVHQSHEQNDGQKNNCNGGDEKENVGVNQLVHIFFFLILRLAPP
jgi:hypothetical protein